MSKAIADKKKDAYIFVPIEHCYIEVSAARVSTTPKGKYLSYIVEADTLDNILDDLGIESVNLLIHPIPTRMYHIAKRLAKTGLPAILY